MNNQDFRVATGTVESLASRLRRRAIHKGVDLSDLKQAGWIAAIRAHRTFDPAHGATLGTHLYRPVRFAMLRELLAMSSPVKVHRDAYALGDTFKKVELDTDSEGHTVPEQEKVYAARELYAKMESIAGEHGASVLTGLMIGQITLERAVEESGLQHKDFLAFREFVMEEMRKH